jgi:hypothetical protein
VVIDYGDHPDLELPGAGRPRVHALAELAGRRGLPRAHLGARACVRV